MRECQKSGVGHSTYHVNEQSVHMKPLKPKRTILTCPPICRRVIFLRAFCIKDIVEEHFRKISFHNTLPTKKMSIQTGKHRRILPFDLSRNPSRLAGFIVSLIYDSLTYTTKEIRIQTRMNRPPPILSPKCHRI